MQNVKKHSDIWSHFSSGPLGPSLAGWVEGGREGQPWRNIRLLYDLFAVSLQKGKGEGHATALIHDTG